MPAAELLIRKRLCNLVNPIQIPINNVPHSDIRQFLSNYNSYSHSFLSFLSESYTSLIHNVYIHENNLPSFFILLYAYKLTRRRNYCLNSVPKSTLLQFLRVCNIRIHSPFIYLINIKEIFYFKEANCTRIFWGWTTTPEQHNNK